MLFEEIPRRIGVFAPELPVEFRLRLQSFPTGEVFLNPLLGISPLRTHVVPGVIGFLPQEVIQVLVQPLMLRWV